MEEKEKIQKIEDMLEMESGVLTPGMDLSDIEEWDSIAVISFIALMDEDFGIKVQGVTVKNFKKVSDVLAIMP